MPNRSGQAYGLTVLSPIIRDRSRIPSHEAEIREYLAQMDRQGGSPLARIPTIHMARWVVIDDVPFVGEPAEEEHLESKYLLLEANFDGERDATLNLMCALIPDTLNAIYSHCVGFPRVGVGDAAKLCRYIDRCQVDTTFYFADYPNARLPDVLRSLDLQRKFVPFITQMQGRSAADVQREFLRFIADRQNAPTPPAGTM